MSGRPGDLRVGREPFRRSDGLGIGFGGEAEQMSEASNWVIPLGFRVAGISAGIKPSGDRDLAVVVADSECAAAGVFTTNRIAAAPVRWDRQRVPSESIRAVVANSGNANAATGAVGAENVRRTAAAAAAALGCKPEQIIVCSTGIIGRQLPI